MDFESGLIYNVFIIIACGLAYWTERSGYRPLGLLLTFAFVVIFWAIRYDIGYDYKGYVTIFYLVKYGYPYDVELGYRWLNKCFTWSQTGYIGALGVMTILSYFFLFKMFIREKILTLGLFFSMAFLLQFMLANQVRQALVLVYFCRWCIIWKRENIGNTFCLFCQCCCFIFLWCCFSLWFL